MVARRTVLAGLARAARADEGALAPAARIATLRHWMQA
jgi:hypothetical protein